MNLPVFHIFICMNESYSSFNIQINFDTLIDYVQSMMLKVQIFERKETLNTILKVKDLRLIINLDLYF